MTDEVWRREAVESPCVRVCVVNPETRLCIGCHRSVEEIAAWGRMSPAERRAVMEELPGRAEQARPKRRGGRRGRLERGG